MLLQEDSGLFYQADIVESTESSPKKFYIRGEFGRANFLNKNGRIYKKEIYEKAIKDNEQMLNEKRMLGEIGHPSYAQINLAEASHVITKLFMEGDILMGEAEVLDTPKGKILKALLESGVKVGISTRAVGSVVKNGNITEVAKDFKLITADIVADPSSQNAFPTPVLEEIQEHKIKINEVFNKVFKGE